MLNLVVFETEEELRELTGLTEHELWQKGFNFDDSEISFQAEVKLHKTPTKKDMLFIAVGDKSLTESLEYSYG